MLIQQRTSLKGHDVVFRSSVIVERSHNSNIQDAPASCLQSNSYARQCAPRGTERVIEAVQVTSLGSTNQISHGSHDDSSKEIQLQSSPSKPRLHPYIEWLNSISLNKST